MATLSHDPSHVAPEKRSWSFRLPGPEIAASLTIMVIWLSVLFDAVFGPDIESSTYLGDHTVVPSAVVLALFAFLATWVVARYGYRSRRD